MAAATAWTKTVGVYCAPPTFFTPDTTRVDLAPIKAQAAWLQAQGAVGVFLGTTGEVASLTLRERLEVATEWVAHRGGLKVIVNVGHNCLSDAVELARGVAAAGVDAVAATVPSYYPIKDVGTYVAALTPVAEAVAPMPFMIYHIPIMTHVDVPLSQVMALAGEVMPNLVGCKYSHGDMQELRRMVALDRFDILVGTDDAATAAMGMGVTGFVGSTYSWYTALYNVMIKRFTSGDVAGANRVLDWVLRVMRVVSAFPFLAANKVLIKAIGYIPESTSPAVRLPNKGVYSDDEAALLAELGTLRFVDVCRAGPDVTDDMLTLG